MTLEKAVIDGDLSGPQQLLCCSDDCSMSIFILSNNDYLSNLSASTVKDHDCFQSPPTSSKNLYISISKCILSVTASVIIQFSSSLEISCSRTCCDRLRSNCPTWLVQHIDNFFPLAFSNSFFPYQTL